nr:hypothetical protein [Paracoccus saliphilus]
MIDWSKVLAPGQRTARISNDGIEELGGWPGLAFLHAGTGIYRLSGHPDLAAAAGRSDPVLDADGQPFADVKATWVDDALVLWVTRNGDLTDIPAGRWITINL